jgi:hypothetical protein
VSADQQQAIETMPWFYPDLDDHLRQALDQRRLPPERRPGYASTITGLLQPSGYLFLKCFSYLQPGRQGPHRFTPEQIQAIFGSQFQVRSVEETVYQSTLDPLPRALFCVLQQKENTP